MIMMRLRKPDGEMYRMLDVEHIDINMEHKRIHYKIGGVNTCGGWDNVCYEDYMFNNTGSMCFIDVWERGMED